MRPAMLIICAALLATACSGDGDADTTTTQVTTPTTTPDTTAAPTTAPATTPPATTDPPTTTSTSTATTIAATTTTSALAQDLDDVETAYRNAWTKLFAARQDPTNDALYQAALDVHTGERLAIVTGQLDSFRSSGRAARPDPDNPASYSFEVEPHLVDGAVAAFRVCEIDTHAIVLVGGGPDGTDAILDDTAYAFRFDGTMELENGAWRIATLTEVGAWPGADRCDP